MWANKVSDTSRVDDKVLESGPSKQTWYDLLYAIWKDSPIKAIMFSLMGVVVVIVVVFLLLWAIVHFVAEPGTPITLWFIEYVKKDSEIPVNRSEGEAGVEVLRTPPEGQTIYKVAAVLNGDMHYAHEVLYGFRSTLDEMIPATGYRAYFEIAIGSSSRKEDVKNQETFKRLLAKFQGEPDLLVTIGTRVSEFAKERYGDKQSIVFIGVTDPIKSGLVKHLEKDPNRGKIAGVLYGLPAEDTLQFYFDALGNQSLGYVYNSDYPQDVYYKEKIESALSSLGKDPSKIVLIEALQPRLTCEQKEQADVFFGRHYLSSNAQNFIEHSCNAVFVGSLMYNVLENQVLVYGINDRELGELAAKEIVLKHLRGTALHDFPILKAQEPIIGVSLQAARKYSISIPQEIVDKAHSVIK